MTIVRIAGSMLLLGSLALLPACGASYADERPDPGALTKGDKGIQSADIIGITDKLAPDVLGIPEVVANPNRISVVVMDMKNATRSRPGEDMNLWTQRLADNLATRGNTHVVFVNRKADTERIQQTEGAGGNPDPFEQGSRTGVAPAPTRRIAQYALTGTLFDQPNNNTTYYYIQFKLSVISGPDGGTQVWTGRYDLKVKN